MKTFFRIMALCLALVLSLSMLVSCIGGKSMDKIVEKIKDLDEDDYMYQKLSKDDREEFVEEMAEELDVDFDGSIKKSISGDTLIPSRQIFAAILALYVGTSYILPFDTGLNCTPYFLSNITPYIVFG